jgi:hypothetical protein
MGFVVSLDFQQEGDGQFSINPHGYQIWWGTVMLMQFFILFFARILYLIWVYALTHCVGMLGGVCDM